MTLLTLAHHEYIRYEMQIRSEEKKHAECDKIH